MSNQQQQNVSQFGGFKSYKFIKILIGILNKQINNIPYKIVGYYSKWINHQHDDNYHCYPLDSTIQVIDSVINNKQLSKIIGEFVTSKEYIHFQCVANCNKSIFYDQQNEANIMAVEHDGIYPILNSINQHIICQLFDFYWEKNISTTNLTNITGPVCSTRCFVSNVFGTKSFDGIGKNMAKEYLLFVVETKLQIPVLIECLIAKYIHLHNKW